VIEALDESRLTLSELQAGKGLAAWNDHLVVDYRLGGMVEAWASGISWKELVESSK
jgi:hypothetical protein